ncbi:hypothetical protein [Athalassotoga saccharophila]|uniref:hypothetical protein n=1 Tax=Athalassotoga saccharophila TaxID=1441386 RepID=UPI00137A5851|nr:hypothetical protein [Athalassotoga saccharophila]BBJ27915.1 hypothetical protein ATHSA_0809 [Athalassotoga saccharophila]
MRKKIILIVLLVIAAYLVYFDITSYISYTKAKSEYEKVLKEYDQTKQELDYLKQTMKEIESQIANSGNNVPQTPSTSGK